MNITFVGYSSIVQRKVLPAAIKAKNIDKISIATSKTPDSSAIPDSKFGKIYNNYDEAIAETNGSLVYISFPNALHAKWVEKALLAGHHVIVDKPAFMSYDDAERLVGIAKGNGLLLAESNVWTYHSLFTEIKKYIKDKNLHSIYANFSSPPLDVDNFRYNPDMGAGIVLDRGSYAISCVRELLPGLPENICCSQRYSKSHSNVDTDLSIMMSFNNKSTFLGFFSLGCEYTNSLEIIGEDFKIYATRIFTPPSDEELELHIQHDNDSLKIKSEPCDAFQEFLEDVINSLHDSTYNKFSDVLLNDAVLLEKIINASNQSGAI